MRYVFPTFLALFLTGAAAAGDPPRVKGFRAPPRVKGFVPCPDCVPCGAACGCPPGACANGRCPAPAANDGYTGEPAPAGYQWQKVGAAPWKLVPVGVAPDRPFGAGSTPGTTAPGAGPSSGWYPGSSGGGLTRTPAPGAGPFGTIEHCSPLG